MILCAALKCKVNDTEVIVPCCRHAHGYELLRDLGIDYQAVVEEGFIDTQNIFYAREDALRHALTIHQLPATVRENIHNNMLFSEDLY